MSLRRLQVLPLAAAVAAMVLTSGCSKNVTGPTPGGDGGDHGDLSSAQAGEIAARVGQQYAGTPATEFTRLLFVPPAGSASPRSAKLARPARVGAVTADGDQYQYELVAYDAAGNVISYESAAWDQIARVVVKWDMSWNWTNTDNPSFYRGHANGSYDLAGFDEASAELHLSGSSRDTLEYRFTNAGYDMSGSALWLCDVSGLRWSKDWTAHTYPLAGREKFFVDQQWSYDDGTNHDSEHLKADVQITYNGSQFAELVVDGRHRFRLDLETGDVTPMPA